MEHNNPYMTPEISQLRQVGSKYPQTGPAADENTIVRITDVPGLF